MKLRGRKTGADKSKRIRRQSSPSVESTPSLPLDLTTEIFLKLPAKSIVRFSCVSKLWSTITTQPDFAKTFETRSKLLLFFKHDDKLFVSSVSQQNPHPNESYLHYSSWPIDSYNMTFPKSCSFTSKTESVHGLICFRKAAKFTVWNPTMRKFLALPTADMSWNDIAFFLGYDPVECKHKVMCMPSKETSDECLVLTLGSGKEESWRKIKTNHKHLPFCGYHMRVHGQCINGVLYYQARLGSGLAMMSFDVRSEKLSMIPVPWEGFGQMRLIIYGRKLACVGYSGNSMWVLEDPEKHQWSNLIFLPPSHYDQVQNFKLVGVTDGGELIYVQSTVFKLLPVIYIHPARKSFRRVEYRGIADEDARQRHGLGEGRLRVFQVFPNHIETLLSL